MLEKKAIEWGDLIKERNTLLTSLLNLFRLLEDRASRYERLFKSRKNLESDWLVATESKKAKDTNDKLYTRTPGALLLEQTDPYKRCGQCKRKVSNCGESNIWRESRYIPGSRLIV